MATYMIVYATIYAKKFAHISGKRGHSIHFLQ